MGRFHFTRFGRTRVLANLPSMPGMTLGECVMMTTEDQKTQIKQIVLHDEAKRQYDQTLCRNCKSADRSIPISIVHNLLQADDFKKSKAPASSGGIWKNK